MINNGNGESNLKSQSRIGHVVVCFFHSSITSSIERLLVTLKSDPFRLVQSGSSIPFLAFARKNIIQ